MASHAVEAELPAGLGIGSALGRRRMSPEAHARRWRLLTGTLDCEPFDIWGVFRSHGWEARLGDLGAATGGLQAIVVPSPGVGFRATVDPAPENPVPPGASQVLDESSPDARFRLAHEFAHTFFYRPGSPPTRSRPPTRTEESFCDHFAAALLIPPSTVSGVDAEPAKRAIAVSYGGPIWAIDILRRPDSHLSVL